MRHVNEEVETSPQVKFVSEESRRTKKNASKRKSKIKLKINKPHKTQFLVGKN